MGFMQVCRWWSARSVRWMLAGILAMMLGHDPVFAQGGAGNAAVEQQVIQASNAWAQALQRDDLDAIDRLLADDFTTIQMTAVGAVMLSKTQQLDALRQGAATRPKVQRDLQSATVRIHGPVAILTAIANYAGQTAAGQVRSQALISEVWVNEGGTWRMTHFQATTAPRRLGV